MRLRRSFHLAVLCNLLGLTSTLYADIQCVDGQSVWYLRGFDVTFQGDCGSSLRLPAGNYSLTYQVTASMGGAGGLPIGSQSGSKFISLNLLGKGQIDSWSLSVLAQSNPPGTPTGDERYQQNGSGDASTTLAAARSGSASANLGPACNYQVTAQAQSSALFMASSDRITMGGSAYASLAGSGTVGNCFFPVAFGFVLVGCNFYITDEVTVEIGISPTPPPTAAPDAYTVLEDGTLSVSAPGVLANDTANGGASLVATVAAGPMRASEFTLNPDGSFTYRPSANNNGPDSFTYAVGQNGDEPVTAVVNLTITPVNDAPTANAQSVTAPQATVTGIILSGSDPDGDTLTFTVVAGPAHGVLSGIPPNLTYTPAPNYIGPDGFTFVVNDGGTSSVPTTVSIDVAAVNYGPVARDDFFTVIENISARFSAEDLLWNDRGPENDALSLTSITPPAHGQLLNNADGSFTYHPANNYFGHEVLSYTVSDGHGGVAVGVATIDVRPLGTVLSWGENDRGQMGNGTITLSENAPVAAANLPDGRQMIAVSAGLRFSVAVDDNGSFWAWGHGEEGQLGNGAQTNSVVPVRVRTPLKVAIGALPAERPFGWPMGIAAGGYHAIGLYEGVLFTWGLNSAGQLGDGTTQNRLSGTLIQLPGSRGPIAIAAGQYFSLALADDGTIWAWGLNVYGELGDGSTASTRSTPGQVSLPGGRLAKGIAAGADHALALASDGTMWAWGLNNYGQLGDGTTVHRSSPVQVGALGGARKPVALAAGVYHSLARADDGTVWSWGDNIVGQLGRSASSSSGTPGQVMALPGNCPVTSLAAGQLHSLALLDDGNIAAWGGNYQGQLGIASPNSSAPPTLVALPHTKRAVGLASGFMHSVALVQNLPDNSPVAVAGADTNVLAVLDCEATIRLNGSASFDPDGDAMTFIWELFSNEVPIGTAMSGVLQDVTLPVGIYTARLTVSTSPDGQPVTSTDSLVINILPGKPSLTTLSPTSAAVNGSGFNLLISGSCFADGAVVYWNDSARPTTRLNSFEIVAAIPGADLHTSGEIAVALVTVMSGGGQVSNPLSFTIVGETVGLVESQVVSAGQTLTVLNTPTTGDDAGVAVTLQNNGGDPVAVVAATYETEPVAGTAFSVNDGTFVDVQITGADSSDSGTVYFYYPSHVIGNAENTLALRYYDGAHWITVLSGGGAAPIKDTTDNLDGTFSGGLFAVMLDNTSTPKITELSGTIFGMFDTTPQVGKLSGPVAPLALGTSATISVPFAVLGDWTAARVTYIWGDGSQATVVPSSSSLASATKTYSAAGDYTVAVRVTDASGNSVDRHYEYIVVYDPNGGFVTGGGWITSPLGAYVADGSLSGKASFAFVSKYLKGATIPTGDTEFQLHFATFNFKSTSYQWLVVSGAKAQYKGSGTINGNGDYVFVLTATDGQAAGGGGVDKFRIKIWNKNTGVTVYDNVSDDSDNPDTATPQAIGGGSIVIHRAK